MSVTRRKRTARRLASRQLITIVALGSSSTAGASSAATTDPSRLMVELAQRFRTQPIIVLNRGVSGERAVDMLAPSTRVPPGWVGSHPEIDADDDAYSGQQPREEGERAERIGLVAWARISARKAIKTLQSSTGWLARLYREGVELWIATKGFRSSILLL